MQSRFQSAVQSEYAKSTSSFFSGILTTTTTKYNTLKRQLISSEADGDTEDDSHIARALRAYYTEKGKQFPEWLPPDPKAPPLPPPTQFVSSSSTNISQQGYAGQPPQQQQAAGGGRWGRQGGGLSDLWGDGNRNSAPAAPDSLRQRPGMVASNSAGSAPMTTQAGRFGSASRFDNAPQEPQSRPLPSQRAGSYQSQSAGYGGGSRFDTASPPLSSSGTAQDRLKARLWGGGRTASPPPSNASTPSVGSSNSRNPYDSVGSAGSGGRNPYADQGTGSSRLGGGGVASPGRPMVSANSPWSSADDPYAGGGGGYDQGNGRPGGGLASGPKSGRQGVGLPSGPRPQRF
jgi:hypothetical protein